MSIQGVGSEGSVDLDLRRGDEADDEGWISALMAWALGMLICVLMGWPRIQNTISGWHEATAWVLLPLLVLSPLTGILMAFRISLGTAPERASPAAIRDAVRMVAESTICPGCNRSARVADGRWPW